MKKVSVVILNYKLKDQTIECIASVMKSTYQNLEIIVVDNNSQDGIENEINQEEVIFLQTGFNLGYTGGNNIGIKAALANNASYIFILNPDTTVESTTIEKLYYCAEKTKSGIIGPKILFSDPKKIWYAGGIFDSLNVIGSHRGVNEEDQGQFNKELVIAKIKEKLL